MSAFYRIVEWDRYQHYKDRDPPWIKLHRDLLTSQTWVTLSDASRVLAVACMLIAAGTDNRIPTSAEYLKRRAYLNKEPDFAPLVAAGFVELVNDGNVVADASKTEQTLAVDTKCSSEERRDREEAEERAFAIFVLEAKRRKWPEPAKLTDDRRKKIRLRLDEHGPDGWQKMIDLAGSSEFINNKFPLKLDWVLEPKNFRKVIEGNYNQAPSAADPPRKPWEKPPSDALPPTEPWEQRLAGWRERKQWLPMIWGPPPGTPGCRAPARLLGDA
jgi:hypothetical protein